jgi:hypothetical protein
VAGTADPVKQYNTDGEAEPPCRDFQQELQHIIFPENAVAITGMDQYQRLERSGKKVHVRANESCDLRSKNRYVLQVIGKIPIFAGELNDMSRTQGHFDCYYCMFRQAQAPIPTSCGKFTMMAYADSPADLMPHLALVADGFHPSSPVPVRIHSECMTGDVFGSMRCDCGDQLQTALKMVSDKGGVVIYLRQEGRGIGLIKQAESLITCRIWDSIRLMPIHTSDLTPTPGSTTPLSGYCLTWASAKLS